MSDIYEIIKEEIASFDVLPSNREIADAVFAKISPQDYGTFLNDVLPRVVALSVCGTHVPMSAPTSLERVDVEPEDVFETPRKPKKIHHQQSTYVSSVQQGRLEILSQVYVGADGVRKTIAKFTVADFSALTADLSKRKDAIERRRKMWASLQVTLAESGLERVEQLTDEQISASIELE